MMLREEWENSEEAESILLIYNHVTLEVTSEIFLGYECGVLVRERRNELEEMFSSCSFSIIDNEMSTKEWLSIMFYDLCEDCGFDEDELEDELDDESSFS